MILRNFNLKLFEKGESCHARVFIEKTYDWFKDVGTLKAELSKRKNFYEKAAKKELGKDPQSIITKMTAGKDTGYASYSTLKGERYLHKVEKYEGKAKYKKEGATLYMILLDFFEKLKKKETNIDPKKETFLTLHYLVQQGVNVDKVWAGDYIMIENGKLYMKPGTEVGDEREIRPNETEHEEQISALLRPIPTEVEIAKLMGEVTSVSPVAVPPAPAEPEATVSSASAKPEAPKPEAPKPEAPKPEAPKPEAPKPEAPKPEAPKPEAPKPEAPKPEAPKPEAPKPEAPKPEAPKSEAIKPAATTPIGLKIEIMEKEATAERKEELEKYVQEILDFQSLYVYHTESYPKPSWSTRTENIDVFYRDYQDVEGAVADYNKKKVLSDNWDDELKPTDTELNYKVKVNNVDSTFSKSKEALLDVISFWTKDERKEVEAKHQEAYDRALSVGELAKGETELQSFKELGVRLDFSENYNADIDPALVNFDSFQEYLDGLSLENKKKERITSSYVVSKEMQPMMDSVLSDRILPAIQYDLIVTEGFVVEFAEKIDIVDLKSIENLATHVERVSGILEHNGWYFVSIALENGKFFEFIKKNILEKSKELAKEYEKKCKSDDADYSKKKIAIDRIVAVSDEVLKKLNGILPPPPAE